MVLEQHSRWGRAYRNGRLVCARVHVTIGHDERLGLSARLQPPLLRCGHLREIEFALRELQRTS
jgi:hypothetical protein